MAENKAEEEEEEKLERAAILREMKKTYPKLVLWHRKDCKPLFIHQHLLPIMETLGFVALRLSPTKNTNFCGIEVPWLEYKYCGSSAITPKTGPFHSNPLLTVQTPRTPKLSYPYIDGLHLYTYRAFLDAVNFYIDNRFSDNNIFHLQGIPANLDDTEVDSWHYVQESKTIVRNGTLDPALKDIYSNDDAVDHLKSFKILPAKEDFLAHDHPEITMDPIDNDYLNLNSVVEDQEDIEEEENELRL